MIYLSFDWEFLSPHIKYILKWRKNLSDTETLKLLEQYKFLSIPDLTEIAHKLTGKYVEYVAEVKLSNLFLDIQDQLEILLEESEDGSTLDLYTSYDTSVTEGTFNIQITSHTLNIHYLLPCNYMQIKYPNDYESMYVWDYYVMFNRYIMECLKYKATDFHWEVIHIGTKAKYIAQMRVDSKLMPLDLFPINETINYEMSKTLVGDRTPKLALDLGSDTGVTTSVNDVLGDGDIQVRVTAQRCRDGYFMVLRIIRLSTISMLIHQLGFEKNAQDFWKNLVDTDDGLIVVGGAPRTGKNTTVYAWCNEVMARKGEYVKIQSLDSPIEVLMPFRQIDYGDNIRFLINSVKLSKKADVDIMVLNEVPSKEVFFAVRDCVNSAMLVITTMHLSRLYDLPYKLMEYGGKEFRDILSQIKGVSSQRMYSRQCPHCLEEFYIAEYPDKSLQKFFEENGITSVKQSVGCSRCKKTKVVYGSPVVLPEFLRFDRDLVLKLFEAKHPYMMEKVLSDAIYGSNQCLEYQMSQAVQDGRLNVHEILTIL